MLIKQAILSSGGSTPSATTYVDEVFNTYTYTGTGVSQTLDTGLSIGDVIDSSADPYFDKVSLLLHADGINTTNTFVDSSLVPKIFTAVGNAQISTTQSKFGGSSAYFDGTGDSIYCSSSTDLNLSSGNFTIEANVYFTGYPTNNAGNYSSSIVSKDVSGGREYVLYVSGTASSITTLNLYAFDTNSTYTLATNAYTFSLSTWYHLAATRSSNTIYLFVNGILIGTTGITTSIQSTSTVLRIGSQDYDATYKSATTGYIDEVRITKGVARYTSNFIVPNAAFPNYLPAVPTNKTYTEAVVEDAPVMYYRLNDTNSTAIATLGSNGSYIGTLYTQSNTGGPTGTGFLTLNDSGTGTPGVTTGNTTNYTTAVTLEAWIKPGVQTDTSGTVVGKRTYFAGDITDFPICLQVNTSNQIIFGLSTGNDFNLDVTLYSNLNIGTWYHIAGVYRSNGVCELYVDGILKHSATISGSISSGSSQWTIGSCAEVSGGANNSTFNGSIAEVAVYNTALSASRIYLHSKLVNSISDPYWNDIVLLVHGDGANNSTSFVDSSTTPKALTAIGGAKISTAQSKFGGSSIYLPSSGSYVEAPTSTALQITGGLFTVEAWIYLTGYPTVDSGGSYISTIVNKNYNTAEEFVFTLYGTASSITSLYFAAYGTPVSLSANASYSFSLNTWYHVAAVKDTNNTLRLFVNGTLLLTTTCAATTFYTSTTPLRIGWLGSYGTYARQFYGHIDELRITKGVARYTSSFNVPTTAFSANVIDHSIDQYLPNTVLLVHANGTNGSTTFTDNSPTVKTLTAVGNAQISTTQSKFGGSSMYFDGTGDYLQIPNNSSFEFGSGDFTIELYYYPLDYTGIKSLVSYSISPGSSNIHYSFIVYSSGSNILTSIYQGSTVYTTTGGVGSTLNTWNHIAAVRSGNTLYCFINGNLTGSVNIAGVSISVLSSPTLHVGIAQTYYPLNGYIDELRITKGKARYTASFNVPTIPFPDTLNIDHSVDPYYSSVSLLVHADGANNSAIFIDSSLNALSGTVTTGTPILSSTQSKFGGTSLYLNGTSSVSYAVASTLLDFGSSPATIEFFYYGPELVGTQCDLIGRRSTNIVVPFVININPGMKVQILIGSAGLSTWAVIHEFTGVSIPINSWAHIALVFSSSNINLFINGTKATSTPSYSTVVSGTQALTIGGWDNGVSHLYALSTYIDELRITKGIARYTSNFNVPTTAFPNSSVGVTLPSTNITAGKGGLVWIKRRDSALSHYLVDSARGASNYTESNSINASAVATNPIVFSPTGVQLPNTADARTNNTSAKYVAWSFAKSAKFFDVVTYTGNGINRTISHNLGAVPGMILIKSTSHTGDWRVYHRSMDNTEYLLLNSSSVKVTGATSYWNSTTATESTFSIGTAADVNTNSNSYVAYLFGHDISIDGLIQCGTFTTDTAGTAIIALGWEPQYFLVKATSTNQPWYVVDTNRSFVMVNQSKALELNSNAIESAPGNYGGLGSDGINITGFGNTITYVYTVIRRPNKVPTLGTKVYQAYQGATTSPNYISGFPVDMLLWNDLTTGGGFGESDRLTGELAYRNMSDNHPEMVSGVDIGKYDSMNGAGYSGFGTAFGWMFKRAPKVFDLVRWTVLGTGSTNARIKHNLSIPPELIITKGGVAGGYWATYVSNVTGLNNFIILDNGSALTPSTGVWGTSNPTSTDFGISENTLFGYSSGQKAIAMLFGTCPGVSKVGTYTGNGTSLSINCGFTTGARFIIIKRYNVAGDWYVWDTVRGIISGNDPHISMDTAPGQVTTDDSIDPDLLGFVVNQVAATNVNVTSANYLFLAIA